MKVKVKIVLTSKTAFFIMKKLHKILYIAFGLQVNKLFTITSRSRYVANGTLDTRSMPANS